MGRFYRRLMDNGSYRNTVVFRVIPINECKGFKLLPAQSVVIQSLFRACPANNTGPASAKTQLVQCTRQNLQKRMNAPSEHRAAGELVEISNVHREHSRED